VPSASSLPHRSDELVSKKKEWFPLDLTELPNCRIIASDPSLTATGLVFLEIHDTEVYVLGAETVATAPTDKVGWEDTFLRTSMLKKAIKAITDKWTFEYGETFLWATHEAPPTNGGPLMRIEASILAGFVFEEIMEEAHVPLLSLVTPQSHKKLLCGNHIAKKPEHHAAVKALLPFIVDGKLITNEGKRDALSIALYAAHRMKETDGSSKS
jgi:hypothetical protein